jgi:hypothetical protein
MGELPYPIRGKLFPVNPKQNLNFITLATHNASMTKFSKIFLLYTVAMIVLTVLPFLSFAQSIGNPGCDPKCNCRKDFSVCPIDSGVWILLAIGIVYGLKKIWDVRKKQVLIQ